MGLSRSSFDDIPVPSLPSDFLGQIEVICDEFQCWGYRCIGRPFAIKAWG